MKALSLCLSLCLAAAPINAIELHRGTIMTLTDEDEAACEAQRGCVYVSRDKLEEFIAEAVKRRAGNCMGSAAWRP